MGDREHVIDVCWCSCSSHSAFHRNSEPGEGTAGGGGREKEAERATRSSTIGAVPEGRPRLWVGGSSCFDINVN